MISFDKLQLERVSVRDDYRCSWRMVRKPPHQGNNADSSPVMNGEKFASVSEPRCGFVNESMKIPAKTKIDIKDLKV